MSEDKEMKASLVKPEESKKKASKKTVVKDESKKPESPKKPKQVASGPKGKIGSHHEWARAFGKLKMLKQIDGSRASVFAPDHAAAMNLHGWANHRHHANGELMLTEDQYLAALEAAQRPVLCTDGKSHYVPDEKARSKYCPHEVFKPV